MTAAPSKRCAIYTRKSSDEGLDQEFNSLDAQREAGEAYVKSQASEGWKLIPIRYDDGGFSGGSMERPALRRLLDDVEAGKIDVVVVYKIDRLTRSLADFARIVEAFDARAVSFVSVTQAFNTTSSMGRLTLNVLLSFAQFEREVTGERIRDKIAASKAKGMWMGGVPPLGYDVPEAGSRTLRVNEAEAQIVRNIYERYLAIGSVHRLAAALANDGVVSKRHVTNNGREIGGTSFGRGALFHLLRNRIYRGQIVHRNLVHQGEHLPIIDVELFDRVQQHLAANRVSRNSSADRRTERAWLGGRLFDVRGEPMSPAHSRGRSGRLYRYYVSTSVQRGGKHKPELHRVAATAIEQLVMNTLERLLPGKDSGAIQLSVHLRPDAIDLVLPANLARAVAARIDGEEQIASYGEQCVVTIPVALPLRGGRRSIVAGQLDTADHDTTLIAALRNAHAMVQRDERGLPIIETSPISPYDRRLLRLAFLAPDIQCAILAGRQPRSLNLEQLIHQYLPIGWSQQRKTLGFAPPL
ncbi:recombinase family protein [Novosphingobium aquiterrae]|uniref:Recombinase family protein n=1 Tax=Novosphingobium aquiterrae TaxID=624388 RepID=A0ABV6PGG5_9SPHN